MADALPTLLRPHRRPLPLRKVAAFPSRKLVPSLPFPQTPAIGLCACFVWFPFCRDPPQSCRCSSFVYLFLTVIHAPRRYKKGLFSWRLPLVAHFFVRRCRVLFLDPFITTKLAPFETCDKNPPSPCSRRLLSTLERYRKSCVGLHSVP